MKPPRAGRPLTECLGADSPLGRLQQHAERLARVQRAVDLLLPDYLVGHVRVANLDQGQTLALHVENAAVASRLKMLTARISEGLWAQGVAVQEIKVRVRPPLHEAEPPPVQRAIADDALDHLDALRETLPDASPLKAPLARLLARAARRS